MNKNRESRSKSMILSPHGPLTPSNKKLKHINSALVIYDSMKRDQFRKFLLNRRYQGKMVKTIQEEED